MYQDKRYKQSIFSRDPFGIRDLRNWRTICTSARTRMSADFTETDPGLEARYANYFKIGQNSTEFLLQFGQFHPGSELVWVARIVTSPALVKELLRMFTESVTRHEASYGEIKAPDEDPGPR